MAVTTADLPELSTIAELAAKAGSKRKAEALLRTLGVPVVQGIYSRRLLLARLEGKDEDAIDPNADPRQLAQELLSDLGFVVVGFHPGRPKIITITAATEDLRIGQPEMVPGEDSPHAPLVVRRGARVNAVLQVAGVRGSSTANFLVAGLDRMGPEKPPLFIFILASERRVWLALRTELRAFKDLVDRGEKRLWFSHAPRPGGLRVAFPKVLGDFEAKARVMKMSDWEAAR